MPSRAQLEAEERERTAQRERTAGHDAFRAGGFPRRHCEQAGGTLAALPGDGPKFVRQAWASLESEGGCVLLLGQRGTGKTQIAVGLARALANAGTLGEGASMRYAVLNELLAAEKRSFDKSTSAATPLEDAARVGLLVLDDLHDWGGTPWDERALTTLIDTRYRELRRTILIANLTPAGAAKNLPASVYSRLLETALTVECNWPSFRKPGGAS